MLLSPSDRDFNLVGRKKNMFECPICQETLLRSDEEVEALFHKLLAISRQADFDFEQLIRAIKRERDMASDSDDDSEEDDVDDVFLRANPVPSIMDLIVDADLLRPGASTSRRVKDCVMRFYSKMVAAKCGHCFHFSCLQQWCHMRNTGSSSSCPMCRKKFSLKEAQILFPSPEGDTDAMIAARYPVLVRWRILGVMKFKNWNTDLQEYKMKFTGNLASFGRSVSRSVSIPESFQTPIIYGLSFLRFLMFLFKLYMWNNVTSYNYQMEDPGDEIEQEMRLESGQFLGLPFAIELFFCFAYCLGLDLLCM